MLPAKRASAKGDRRRGFSLVAGYWLLVTGHWLLVGNWRLARKGIRYQEFGS